MTRTKAVQLCAGIPVPARTKVGNKDFNADIKSAVTEDNPDYSMLKRLGTIFKLNHFVPARSPDLAGFVSRVKGPD